MYDKRILILGAGVMQIPALRWSVDRGWKVFVADGNPDAPGLEYAHEFVPVDLSDVEGMIQAARTIRDREGLDGVFTAGTDFSYTVARVAEALGLPGLPSETALAASNKAVMRQIFQDYRVSSPHFFILHEGERPENALESFDFPLVVKPVDNMGSRGIRRIDTVENFLHAVETARKYSRSRTVIVEEYIPGEEYSIDALVVNGKVHFTGIADRHIFFPPYFVEMGHTIPTATDGHKLGLIKETFIDAVNALGIRDGAAKGDVKWTGDRAVIGELAARLSGGYMSGWTFPYSSGVELTGAALKQAVGEHPGDLRPKLNNFSAERAFISIPGTVESVENLQEARLIPGIRELFLRVEPGDRVDFPTNNVEKCGNFIAVMDRREDAVEAAEEACRRVFVRLRPGDSATCRFLFQEERELVPPAFSLEDPENLGALKDMDDFQIPGSEKKDRPAVALLPLSRPEKEKARDWQGTSFSGALARVREYCKGILVPDRGDADILIGRLFWDAFLRGGIQAGVWIIETLHSEYPKQNPEQLRECR